MGMDLNTYKYQEIISNHRKIKNLKKGKNVLLSYKVMNEALERNKYLDESSHCKSDEILGKEVVKEEEYEEK